MSELLLVKYQLGLKQAIEAFKHSHTHLEHSIALTDIIHNLACMPTIDGDLSNAVDDVLDEILPARHKFWMRFELPTEEELERLADWQGEKERITPILASLKAEGLSL